MTIIKPKSIREKNSGGPIFKANSETRGADSIRPIIEMVPAISDPKALIPSAGPARPCRAIGYPSMHVTTLAASPGMFTNMDVVEPPYMAP